MIDLDGGKIERILGAGPYYASDGLITPNVVQSRSTPRLELFGHAGAAVRRADRAPVAERLNVLEGGRRLVLLAVLRPSGPIGSMEVDRYDVVAVEGYGTMTGSNMGPPDWMLNDPSSPLKFPLNLYFSNSSAAFGDPMSWSAEEKQVNTWTIEIPDALTAAAREALEAEEVAKTKKPEAPKPARPDAATPNH